MPQYNKSEIGAIAKEYGFVRDTFEKVLRLKAEKGKVDPDVLDSYLETHLVNPALCRADNFDDYFLDRAKKILDLIEGATNKKIDGRDSEIVIRDFGGSLL